MLSRSAVKSILKKRNTIWVGNTEKARDGHSTHRKTGPFVILLYLWFDSYKLHENFQKYVGGVACCEYGINVYDSLTIICEYRYNETTENYHANKHKTRSILMQGISLCDSNTQHYKQKLYNIHNRC